MTTSDGADRRCLACGIEFANGVCDKCLTSEGSGSDSAANRGLCALVNAAAAPPVVVDPAAAPTPFSLWVAAAVLVVVVALVVAVVAWRSRTCGRRSP